MTSNNTNSVTTLTITRPDDWHVHLRDGDQLKDTVRDISRYMGRAIVMPNLVPPATCTDTALSYRERIMSANPQGNHAAISMAPCMGCTVLERYLEARAGSPHPG